VTASLAAPLGFSEDGGVSTTDASETAPAPDVQPPTPRRGLGSLRSMVISMVVILAGVLAWVAMVPRVREVSQPAVDVTSVATQVRRQTGWAISQPRLPAGWKATNVRFTAAGGGVETWHAGYLSPDGQYVSIDQTPATGASQSWVAAVTSNGQAEGTLAAAGTTWRKLSSRDTVQRSLLSRAPGVRPLITVLSGTAPYAQLAEFAEALEPVPAPAS
jgi:Tfp pilus assembly protein PilV